MNKKQICKFAVASCAEDGGIYKYTLYEDGTAEPCGRIAMPMPMFFEVDGKRITALLRAPFADSEESGICVYDAESGAALTPTRSTKGVVGCHIAVYDDTVYCANYITGSVFMTPDKCIAHTGSSVNPKRQESPHVHCTFFSPDKKHLLCCDLGTDEIYVYDRALNEITRARVPSGNGPRHLCFSEEGKYVYCINEMSATVSVLSYEDGFLTYLKDIDIKPEGYNGQGAGAAIKRTRDGKRLYLSERGSQTIALVEIDGERIEVKAYFSSNGAEPRDIALLADERFLVCTNQFSNNFTVYRVLEGGALELTDNIPLAAPLCVNEL